MFLSIVASLGEGERDKNGIPCFLSIVASLGEGERDKNGERSGTDRHPVGFGVGGFLRFRGQWDPCEAREFERTDGGDRRSDEETKIE